MATHESGGTDRVLETSFGERFEIRETGAETEGELVRIDTCLDPGVRRPLHSHPKQDERFVVREGTLALAVGDGKRLLEAGEETTVAAGTPHTFWNPHGGEREVRFTTEHRPALRFDEFVRAMVALDREGGLDSDGMPANPLVGATLLEEFRDEMRAEDVPLPVQRLVFPVLAGIGGVLGYGAPEPDAPP
ncbi:Cupin domain-containing protein [Halobiforma haloterrestris]|uniref:Cupin domain-containing protein n=1 Tax=Natronobacterium haloterrestre TaxID=148448 RepID=A0A1I1DIL4_NATHA|nr:cupin domain-containing protein [Halobiforma haloterrestris]SFB72363.1 Cupin domain-containing protein [Halobiforma haloterrestris]